MTGLISPYYLKAPANGIYSHLTYVSPAAALDGQCITSFHGDGKYHFARSQEEISYYRKRADALLSKARPLMEIFRRDSASAYSSFMGASSLIHGTRHNILSSPPLYTLTDDFLERFFSKRDIPEEKKEEIRKYLLLQRQLTERILTHSLIFDEAGLIEDRDEYKRFPAELSISGLFPDERFRYSFEEYTEHLELTRRFSATHKNYKVSINGRHAFRNIQIRILEGQWALISKNDFPVIHFVIRNPKLRSAIESMVIPVSD